MFKRISSFNSKCIGMRYFSNINSQKINVPTVDTSIYFICDIQSKFVPLIPNSKRIIVSSKFLLDSLNELEIPIICTEQYPSAFGNIVDELKLRDIKNDYNVYSKTQFSMLIDDVKLKLNEYKGRNNIILTGVETHICIYQTCIDLINHGYNVYLCGDAIGSQRDIDKEFALKQLNINGINITTTESILYQLIQDSNHSNGYFKKVLKHVKTHIDMIKSIE